MSSGDKAESRGVYDSPIRREQAELTRRRIADAAWKLFMAKGYARTSIREIAKEAGVAEPTIYASYGNKRAVLFGVMDQLDMAADVEQTMQDLAEADGDPVRQLRIFIAYDRHLFERGRNHLLILRDAGSSEPELVNTYRQGRERGHQVHVRAFTRWQEHGHLVTSLSAEHAADLYHAISSLDSFDYLVFERGWTIDEWEEQMFQALSTLLIEKFDSGSETPG